MREILIIGCGYVGLEAGRLLCESGYSVRGTTRGLGAERLHAAGIEPLVADVLDPDSLARLPRADAVLFCVGYDRRAGVPVERVYVDGLRHSLQALAARSGRWVYTSSTGVYGQNDGSWVDERAPTRPVTPSARACLAAEELLASTDVDAVVLRLAGLYGPGRLPRRASLERGEPIAGDPEHWLNLVHVTDAARACVAALTGTPPARRYNVADDEPVTRRRFYTRLAALLGAAPPRFQPVSDPSGRDGTHKRVDARRIKADLGLECLYPTIDAGLPAALAGPGPSAPGGSD